MEWMEHKVIIFIILFSLRREVESYQYLCRWRISKLVMLLHKISFDTDLIQIYMNIQ